MPGTDKSALGVPLSMTPEDMVVHSQDVIYSQYHQHAELENFLCTHSGSVGRNRI